MIIEGVLQEESYAGGQATIAALARTARCFEDAALNKLWCVQHSFAPLVKCFPAELWEETCNEDGVRVLVSTLSWVLSSEWV